MDYLGIPPLFGEMRVMRLLWYTIYIYNTTETIVTSSSIADAYRDRDATECLHEKKSPHKILKIVLIQLIKDIWLLVPNYLQLMQ